MSVGGSSNELRSPIFGMMDRIPGGIMIIPLIAGAIIGTFLPSVLDAGSFTTALLRDSALPLTAVLIFATGMQLTPKTLGPVAGVTTTIVVTKTIIPGLIIVALGLLVGMDGIFGISILALLAAVPNGNGGLWLAFTSKYGDRNDRGAYVAHSLNDGPFFPLLFIGASGFGEIPLGDFAAAIAPLILGIIAGNIDHRWAEIMKPVPAIVIPFLAFSLGTGIDLGDVLTGGMTGLILGLIIAPFTGGLTYLGYKYVLKKKHKSGLGWAAGTTAGNAVITPSIVASVDSGFAQYVEVATVQVATAVLISALMAPLIAAWFLKRSGGLYDPETAEAEKALQ